jgi:hypothetical protein
MHFLKMQKMNFRPINDINLIKYGVLKSKKSIEIYGNGFLKTSTFTNDFKA